MTLPIQLTASPGVVTAPPPAVAVGFTKLLRRNVFINTSGIDLSNTGVDGFDWYIRFAWPNVTANNVGNVGDWSAGLPNSSGNYSIVNGNLVVSSGAPASKLALASACYSATDMRGYVGNFLPRSFYAEASISFHSYSFGDCAFWSQPLRFFNGTASPTWIEQDWAETGTLGVCAGNCVHQGSLTWTAATGTNNGGPLYQASPNPVSTEFHTWGALCMSPSDNGGNSKYQIYLDNVSQHTADISLDIQDGDKWMIFFSGGITLAYCNFWVPP